jgi:hypothetical protein
MRFDFYSSQWSQLMLCSKQFHLLPTHLFCSQAQENSKFLKCRPAKA